MKVQIRVLANSDEINEAKNKNAYYAKLRAENESKGEPISSSIEDVEVPKENIVLSDMLIDVKDVMRARVNEIGNISIVHLGQETQIVYSDEIWKELEKRFDVIS